MTRRERAYAIIGVLWLGAIVAITVAFIANRPSHQQLTGQGPCLPAGNKFCIRADIYATARGFSWGGFMGWAGAVTLIAIVAVVIVTVTATAPRRAS